MTIDEILSSEAVAVTWGNHVLGWASIIIPISVALSSFGAGNGSCFTSGRLAFAAAREGHLVDVLSFIDMRRYTPSPALVFNALLSSKRCDLFDDQQICITFVHFCSQS